MRKFAKVLAGLVFMAGMGVARADFEGVVDYHMTMSDNKQMDTEYMIKGKKFRMNMNENGHDMSTIMDLGSKKVITLMHKQKMYMVHKMDKAMTEASKHKPEGKFTKASDSKSILGHACDHWIYEGKHGKTDFWGAKDLGAFMGLGGQGKTEDWIQAIKGKGLFPLELDTTTQNGKTMTMKATKVEKKSLSSSLFEPPADYKKMEMPDMGSMTGGDGKQPSKEDIMKKMKDMKF